MSKHTFWFVVLDDIVLPEFYDTEDEAEKAIRANPMGGAYEIVAATSPKGKTREEWRRMLAAKLQH